MRDQYRPPLVFPNGVWALNENSIVRVTNTKCFLLPAKNGEDAWWSMHGNHAQNYHIFTLPRDKSWAMLWGPAQWLKELPYSNAAYSYDFEHGESGQLTLEFWITPFDYAGAEGPQRGSAIAIEGIPVHWIVMGGHRLRQRERKRIKWILELVPNAYHVWPGIATGCLSPDAFGTIKPSSSCG